jgi:LysM repeat protein
MLYIVQPEDCLELNPWRFDVSMPHLFQYNSTTYYYPLYVGQIRAFPLPHSRTFATYTVTTGDTLDSIAQMFNTTKQSIMQLNNLSSEVLVAGQKLKIDTGSGIPSSSSREIKNYVVQVGDTLDSIAQKFTVTKQSIMSLNNLNSDFIIPDQVLKVPTRSDKTYNNYRPLTTYTIQVGDTLETIANQFHTTKKALMELNGLVSEVLRAGDILKVDVPREYFVRAAADPQNDIDISININSKYDFFSIHDFSLGKNIKIWKELSDGNTFFFVSKMAVTAAGASTAFHKENQLAFDFLDNAGINGYWWSLVTDDQEVPLIQGINDPSPGYFVSKTALSDCKKPLKDPTRYVDATVIPYISLPAHHMMDAKLGDLCVVINTLNSEIGYAIIADVGPDDSLGIGSIALAKDIGIVSSPKLGGVEDGILYIVFSQSGKGWCKLKTREQVINEAQQLFKQWGGIEKVHALFDKFPLSHTSIQ